MSATIRCRWSRARAPASPGSAWRAIRCSPPDHVEAARPVQAGPALRQPQGGRSAPGAGRHQPLSRPSRSSRCRADAPPLPDGTQPVDMLVRQVKGKWRSLAASAGYGTGEGIKLQGSWTNRNLFPPEGALILAAVAGTQQQSVTATFRRSNAGKRDRTFQASASGRPPAVRCVQGTDDRSFRQPVARQHADLAEALDLLDRRRADRDARARQQSRQLRRRHRGTYFIAAMPAASWATTARTACSIRPPATASDCG